MLLSFVKRQTISWLSPAPPCLCLVLPDTRPLYLSEPEPPPPSFCSSRHTAYVFWGLCVNTSVPGKPCVQPSAWPEEAKRRQGEARGRGPLVWDSRPRLTNALSGSHILGYQAPAPTQLPVFTGLMSCMYGGLRSRRYEEPSKCILSDGHLAIGHSQCNGCD